LTRIDARSVEQPVNLDDDDDVYNWPMLYAVRPGEWDLTDKQANQHLLSRLLRRRADILELPVQFVPLSPEKVKRTSAFDGLQALLAIVRERFSSEAIVPRTAAPRVAEGAAVSPKPRRGEGG